MFATSCSYESVKPFGEQGSAGLRKPHVSNPMLRTFDLLLAQYELALGMQTMLSEPVRGTPEHVCWSRKVLGFTVCAILWIAKHWDWRFRICTPDQHDMYLPMLFPLVYASYIYENANPNVLWNLIAYC